VGGLRLYGVLSAEGPAIMACSLDGEQPAGHVALVVSGLRRFLPQRFGMRPGPWGCYIVKYQSEVRVYLDGFTDQHVRRLYFEFGPLPVDNPNRQRGSAEAFHMSQAWIGLVRWVGVAPTHGQADGAVRRLPAGLVRSGLRGGELHMISTLVHFCMSRFPYFCPYILPISQVAV